MRVLSGFFDDGEVACTGAVVLHIELFFAPAEARVACDSVLDIQPAWTFQLQLKQENFQSGSVATKDVAEGFAKVFRQYRRRKLKRKLMSHMTNLIFKIAIKNSSTNVYLHTGIRASRYTPSFGTSSFSKAYFFFCSRNRFTCNFLQMSKPSYSSTKSWKVTSSSASFSPSKSKRCKKSWT